MNERMDGGRNQGEERRKKRKLNLKSKPEGGQQKQEEEQEEDGEAIRISMPMSDNVKWVSTMDPTKMKKVCGHSLEELRVLGKGGQASVTLCKDTHTGKLLALKTAFGERLGEEGREEEGEEEEGKKEETRFDMQMEFETVKFLVESDVPGIVPVHGIGRDDATGKLCMLMDYCDGGTLLSELRRRPFRRLSERRAAQVLSSLAQTLEHCHKHGIMHRDVKLENVLIHHGHQADDHDPLNIDQRRALKKTSNKMVEDDGHLDGCRFLLADFGLARRFMPGELICDGFLIGTSEYIAPEMIKGAYDERADVWSLGILLHLLLTGHFPFHDPQQQHQQQQQRRRSSLVLAQTSACPRKLDMDSSPLYKHLSQGACALLQGMLRKNPSRRLTLSGVRSHPWLQSLHGDAINGHGETATIGPTTFVGAKRIRFVTHTGPDIVRDLHPPATPSSQDESIFHSGLTNVIEPASFVRVKRIRFITHAVPDTARKPLAAASHSDASDTDNNKPISITGVKRIRFINHNGPDVVRDLHMSPKKINDAKAVQDHPPCHQQCQNSTQVPQGPRQHRPRYTHTYYKEIYPPNLLQAAC